MSTTGGLITTVYENVLAIGGEAAEDLEHRLRLLLHLRRAVRAMWIYRPWSWALADIGEIDIDLGASSGPLPDDYYGPGPNSQMWVQGRQVEVEYRRPRIVRRALQFDPNRKSREPEIWTVAGFDTDPDVRKRLIRIYPKASVAITLELTDYQRKPPVLVDEVATPPADPDDPDGTELDEVPEEYHETILAEYMGRRVWRDEGDDREPLQDAEFRKAIADAWANENPEQIDDEFMATAYGDPADS